MAKLLLHNTKNIDQYIYSTRWILQTYFSQSYMQNFSKAQP